MPRKGKACEWRDYCTPANHYQEELVNKCSGRSQKTFPKHSPQCTAQDKMEYSLQGWTLGGYELFCVLTTGCTHGNSGWLTGH